MALIPTARGDTIDAKDAGFSLMTECILGPGWAEIERNWPDFTIKRWPEEELLEMAAGKLKVAYDHGVRTILDRVIPGETGRDPRRLKRLALKTPVNIIMGTGWYTWHYLPYFFAAAEQDTWIRDTSEMSADEIYFMEHSKKLAKESKWPTLEQLMLRDIEVGVIDTGIRAGFIKIVTDVPGLTPDVTKVIKTAAKVHRKTGVFITTHTGIGVGVAHGALQQGLLAECGVDLTRVILGHLDWTPPEVPIEEFVKLADKGSMLSFDTLHLAYQYPERWRAKRIERVVELCKRGYVEQVLISHDDSCHHDVQPEPPRLFPTYCEVTLDLIPKLMAAGLSQKQIDQITIGNPRRMWESNGKGGY